MPILKHYKAIRCIEKRIEELNKEIALSEKIMDGPELICDYEFALSDVFNFNTEIDELRNTIQHLIKT